MTRRLNPGAATGVSLFGSGGLGWQEQAACKGEDPELFFSRTLEPDADLAAFADAEAAREAKAKAICSGCAVNAECGQFATATGQRFGIWAGVDRERSRPVGPEPPVPCSKGLHLMTPENSKPLPGTAQVRCRACLRDADRRTRPARHARNAEARNARDRARYAEKKQAEGEVAA